MFPRLPPQVTPPNRNILLSKVSTDSATPQPSNSPFSPLSFFNFRQSMSPSAPSGMTLIPRAPIVHFFVCDYGNAKVHALTDEFIQILISNGIKVYTEKYLTHQPGFRVQAESLNTKADFFIQIHSKTAAPGHVRLYENGKPKKMTKEEAVSTIWSNWRCKNGALSSEEVDLLSKEKLVYLLKEYANIEPQNLDISSLQIQSRDAIERGICVRNLTEKMREIELNLRDSRTRLISTKLMSFAWSKEPGAQISRIIQSQPMHGLSQPLKDVLISIVDTTLRKVKAIIDLLDRHYISTPPTKSQAIEDPSFLTSQNFTADSNDQDISTGISRWSMMVESVDEDRFGSVNIASYGDGSHPEEVIQVFMLDEY
ncbi:hypothetical protein TRFO_42707 [Tritrichomonas foetus]|uniref:Uncharacterized protein n=1 Tax=Tritrichomonas foetus TaxID=1144522 RepID=A0A1J4KW69_9EUKA|nr:hypothetical protein TRFO_42707 [Tritrichomonas foetus]|eukprot:OHT15128.1 hypothetical protein TRFO_42707 [Tritrichomonas foetus]